MMKLNLHRVVLNVKTLPQIFNLERKELCTRVASLSLYSPKTQFQPSLSSALNIKTQHCGCFANTFNIPNGSLYNSVLTIRHYATPPDTSSEVPEPKPTLYQRFKAMYKDYWYVLLPVHLVTSAAWFGSFYYMASSGVDIVALLEKLNVSDKLINPLRNGHATTGYLAISYALYKIATPLRYTVTLGGTTVSINYLKKWGYIQPVPSKEKLKDLLRERSQSLKDNMMHSLKPSENN